MSFGWSSYSCLRHHSSWPSAPIIDIREDSIFLLKTESFSLVGDALDSEM